MSYCLLGMCIAAQLSLLGVWLGCGGIRRSRERRRWDRGPLAGELLYAVFLLPGLIVGAVIVIGCPLLPVGIPLIVYYLSQGCLDPRLLRSPLAMFAVPIVFAPGHLLGAFLGMRVLRLYDLNITREPALSIHRFQFSVRKMLLLMTALAVVLGIGVWCFRTSAVTWQSARDDLQRLLAVFRVVGPPAFIAPLAAWAALNVDSPYPRLAIALAVVLALAFLLVVGVPRAYALPRGGEFLIVAAELSVLRSKGYRLALPGSGNRGKAFASPARRAP